MKIEKETGVEQTCTLCATPDKWAVDRIDAIKHDLYTYDGAFLCSGLEVNFCPTCGRKLMAHYSCANCGDFEVPNGGEAAACPNCFQECLAR